MATRIHLFLKEKGYKLEAWEDAGTEFKRCVDNYRISVSPGHNLNHANIEIQCDGMGLTLKFTLCDL
ncbi:hypothetical protein [Paenibacillus sp. 2TAB19]|uniref:hypothetical protein n=1 Tax=Paenibacillus sp. 2TAB19 TaxID=3233003 RepID=UPI003F9B8B7C